MNQVSKLVGPKHNLTSAIKKNVKLLELLTSLPGCLQEQVDFMTLVVSC
jgi:hypothetical protein